MPCFNHARFVADSAKGVSSQTHSDLELIIVDDCSSDNSWEVICALATGDSRIRPFRHERNQGASKSRNDGLRAAKGEFIGFCDADDIWEREKLKIQVALLENNPDCDVAYCDSLIIDENGLHGGQRFSERFPPPKTSSGWLFSELVGRNFINMQSVVMRKECLRRAGNFDEGIMWVEDWWYWVRLSRHHRFLYSEEPLARYRIHSRSTNRVQQRGYSVNRFKVFKRILLEYADLSPAAKGDIIYKMGIDLCNLGKYRAGRRLLWEAVRLSMTDPRAFSRFCKASVRIVLSAGTRQRMKLQNVGRR